MALAFFDDGAGIERHYASLATRYRMPLEDLRDRMGWQSKTDHAPSASYNNALAIAQSRSTVRPVTPKANAVSVSEKPAK